MEGAAMLEKVVEQWLANSQLGDPVIKFIESGGDIPNVEQLKRAAANPLLMAYLRKGLELFHRLSHVNPQAAVAAQVYLWRLETVLEAIQQIRDGAQQGQTQKP
jgi:hypothetical protein